MHSRWIAAAMLFAIAGPARADWPACDPHATTQTITFVHVNDLHAHYHPDATGTSPYARIRGYFDRVRAENPYSLFTDGGDDYEKGSLADVLSHGVSTREVMALMQWDVRVIGNHDFAYSLEEVLRMSHDANAAVLCSNVRYTGQDPIGFGATDFVIRRIGCLRVGFAGFVSSPWDERDRPINEDFYPEFPSSWDFVAGARRIVAAHRSEVDLLVFVDHLGLQTDEELARRVPGIDVILSGHSHTLTPSPSLVGSTMIVQSGSYAEHAVRLDIQFDLAAHSVRSHSFSVIDTATQTPDRRLDASIRAIVHRYAPHAADTIAVVHAARNADFIAAIAARAARERFRVDAALIDQRTVHETWRPGPVTPQSLLDSFRIERERSGTPGFSSLYLADVDGESLALIRDHHDTRFAYDGPSHVDPHRRYRIALQKFDAMHPEEYLPATAHVSNVRAASEVWEALEVYARRLGANCQYLDDNASVPGCRRARGPRRIRAE